MKKTRPTVKDVAQSAGVSTQTVSRVLNNSPKVKVSTREKVLHAISLLNYRPDANARALITGRSFMIGVIVRNFGYTPSQILEGAVSSATMFDYQLLIVEHTLKAEEENQNFSFLLKQNIDGLLIVYQGSEMEHWDEFSILSDIPIVTIGHEIEGLNVTRIEFNNRLGGYMASEALITLGHKKIVMIEGTAGFHNAIDRSKGYMEALQAYGINRNDALIVNGDWSMQGGYKAIIQLIENGISFSAVFAHNDLMAIGAVKALKDRGYRVPEDVSVIGFDNIDHARFSYPPLSTVHYPSYKLGSLCLRILVEKIEQGSEFSIDTFKEELEVIRPQLVMRESCAHYHNLVQQKKNKKFS